MTKEDNDKAAAAELDAICVICHSRSQSPKYKPFCSKRCADVDLHRWLGGVYAIPAESDIEDDEMPSSNEPESER